MEEAVPERVIDEEYVEDAYTDEDDYYEDGTMGPGHGSCRGGGRFVLASCGRRAIPRATRGRGLAGCRGG